LKRLAWLGLVWLAACTQTPPQSTADTSASRTETAYRARIHTELAAHYYTRGQYSIAFDEIKEALASEPNHAPAYNVLALVHAKLREDKQAEENFRKAIDLSPGYSEVRNNYGYYLCQRQRYSEGLPYFESALQNPLYASPEKALANAGLCALHQGDANLAETYLQRALARSRNQPTALLGMAELEMGRRNPVGARSYLVRLLEQNEFRPQALWLGVRVERALGNRDNEATHGVQLRRDFPESAEVRRLLDGQYDRMGTMP
jgi:type IV pilus assembly protein PilF